MLDNTRLTTVLYIQHLARRPDILSSFPLVESHEPRLRLGICKLSHTPPFDLFVCYQEIQGSLGIRLVKIDTSPSDLAFQLCLTNCVRTTVQQSKRLNQSCDRIRGCYFCHKQAKTLELVCVCVCVCVYVCAHLCVCVSVAITKGLSETCRGEQVSSVSHFCNEIKKQDFYFFAAKVTNLLAIFRFSLYSFTQIF